MPSPLPVPETALLGDSRCPAFQNLLSECLSSLPGPEGIKTVFIIANFLVLQAPSQAPRDPDGLAQSAECWPPARCSLPAPAFAPPPPGF